MLDLYNDEGHKKHSTYHRRKIDLETHHDTSRDARVRDRIHAVTLYPLPFKVRDFSGN